MKAEFKPVFNEQRMPLHEILPIDTPMSVGICPSQACNIRCVYCFHSLSDKEIAEKGFVQKNMPWDIFLKTVEQLREFPRKIKSISMAGMGEPLFNSRFAEMLLNKKRIEDIVDAGLDRIFISLQGMTAEKYKEVCGARMDFDAFVDTLGYLYEYSRDKCRVNIKIADVALEEGDRERFLTRFGNICDTIHVETIKPLYGDVDYTELLGENASDLTTTRFGRPHKKQKACYLAFYMMCITPLGDIRTCGTPTPACPALKNIKDWSLVEAWNSEARREFLLAMLEGRRFENPVCKDCDFPNDVPTAEDEIDPYAEKLIPRFSPMN